MCNQILLLHCRKYIRTTVCAALPNTKRSQQRWKLALFELICETSVVGGVFYQVTLNVNETHMFQHYAASTQITQDIC